MICKPLRKKKGNRELTNIRPIALQNALAKLASKILAARLTSELSKRKILHPANEGFLRNTGTSNAIDTILNIFEDATEKGKACYNVSYDCPKAFDHLR